MKRFLTLLIVLSMLMVPLMPASVFAGDEEEDEVEEQDEGLQEGKDYEWEFDQDGGARLQLFFDGDKMKPTVANGTADQITTCQGRAWGGRFMGTTCGEWKMPVLLTGIMTGVDIRLWAKSPTQAKNAGFRVNLFRNGGNMQDYYTNRQTVATTPIEFSVSKEGGYTQQFNEGDEFTVGLVWLAEPTRYLGPSGSGEFLYASAPHPSRIIVSFDPHPINVTNVTLASINKDTCVVQASFKDALNADPAKMFYFLDISGPVSATPKNLKGPKPSIAAGNSSSVSWIWHHHSDNAPQGRYTAMVAISYDGNGTAIGMFGIELKLPGGGSKGGGILGLDLGNDMLTYLLIIIVVLVAVGIAVKIVRKRRAASYDDDYYDDDYYDDEE